MADNASTELTAEKARYRQLIDQLCAQAGIADSTSLYENASFSMDEVDFTLLHPDVVDADMVIVVADFGKPPAERRDEILQRLMEANLYTYCDREGPSFCISPESGNVVLMNRMSLSSTTVDSVQFLMTSLVDMIKLWRTSFFLQVTETEQG